MQAADTSQADRGGLSPNVPLKAAAPAGYKQAVLPSDAGDVVMRWPAVLTPAEYEDLEAWIDMLKRTIKRSVTTPAEPQN